MYRSDKRESKSNVILSEILIKLDQIDRRLKILEWDQRTKVKPKDHFWKRFLDTVSIVGFREIGLSRQHAVRFIWLIIFITCFSSTGYFVYKTLLEYWKEPTATKVKLIEQAQYDYPSMLFCPDTWLDADKAIADGLSVGGLQYALGFLINYYVRPPPYKIDNYSLAKRDFEFYYHQKRFADLTEFFEWVSLDSRDFVCQCPFCKSNAFRKILMSGSVCYEIPMHSTPGSAPVINSLDHLDVIVPDRSRKLLSPSTYWRLFLGLDLQLGEATMRHAEIYPRRMNTIQFITHRFISTDKPHHPCVMDTRNYSFARCVLRCFLGEQIHFLMTTCNKDEACDNSMLIPNQTYNYYEEDLWTRLASMRDEENPEKGHEAPKHCYDDCPSPCQRTIYTIDVQSHARVPAPRFTPPQDLFLEKGGLNFGTSQNVTRLSFLNTAAVYGGVLTFEEVSTYSFDTLLGNVGGMLSLWTGINVMTIMQMLMFIVTQSFGDKEKRKISRNHTAPISGVVSVDQATVI